jgi:hypothetical protein
MQLIILPEGEGDDLTLELLLSLSLPNVQVGYSLSFFLSFILS